MDKQVLNKGYSLIEILIVLMIVSLMGALFLKPIESTYLSFMEFQSSYIHTQFIALKMHSKVNLITKVETEFPITFNSNGNVNMGQTVVIINRALVIMLGTGRIHEKSILDD